MRYVARRPTRVAMAASGQMRRRLGVVSIGSVIEWDRLPDTGNWELETSYLGFSYLLRLTDARIACPSRGQYFLKPSASYVTVTTYRTSDAMQKSWMISFLFSFWSMSAILCMQHLPERLGSFALGSSSMILISFQSEGEPSFRSFRKPSRTFLAISVTLSGHFSRMGSARRWV